MTYNISRATRLKIAVYALELEPDLSVARAAYRVGVRHAEVTFAWRMAYGSRNPRIDESEEDKIEPFAQLCDDMADLLTDQPQASGEIFKRFADVHERRRWRALRRLVETRRAVKHGESKIGFTYTRGVA